MRSISIRELRDTRQLKAWLEGGETVQLRDRSRVIGAIVPQPVFSALQERMESVRVPRQGLAARLLAIGERAAALPVLDDRTPEELLYDEYGAPK